MAEAAHATTAEPAIISRTVSQLQDDLQALWIAYLRQLEAYSAAQTEISRLYSSGAFSLAQANFRTTSGRPYGRDQYDLRMQACTRLSIRESLADHGVASETAEHITGVDGTAPLFRSRSQLKLAKMSAMSEKDASDTTAPSTHDKESAPNDSEMKSDDTGGAKPGSEEKTSTSAPSAVDPIRWFGILVPPQLRASQQAFLELVTGPALDATAAARSLRRIESDIRRMRKQIRKAERTKAT